MIYFYFSITEVYMLRILGLLLKFLVTEYYIAWWTFSLLRMKGIMVDMVWPSAWLKDHHRFYFSLLLHKPLVEHKFRGERFALSCWVSFKGEDLPCFSITQGKALKVKHWKYWAWDSLYLQLPQTCTDVIPFLHPPFLPPVWPGGPCSQKLFRLIQVLHPSLLRGCERQKYFVVHLNYHPTNPCNLRCCQVDSVYQS